MFNKFKNHIFNKISVMKPQAILLASFATAIFIGTFLLWMPFSHNGNVGLLEAIFTAASAVCVTGLIVVDTGKEFTFFGQCIILFLIQMGGLGVMTFAALVFDLIGKRLSLSSNEAMTTSLVHEGIIQGFKFHFKRMLYLILIIEIFGMFFLYIGFRQSESHQLGSTLFSAIFHSISAFCNAGFSLYSDNLMSFKNNWIVMFTISFLIIIGGIGYPVLFDFWQNINQINKFKSKLWNRFNIHSKITITTSFIILIVGSILLFLSGLTDKLSFHLLNIPNSIFQSITARTAGFNSIIIEQLPLSSLIIIMILMFIGGSPGSCAGGIKTTTFALWINRLWNRIIGKKDVIIMGRYIPSPIVRRGALIISITILWNVVGILFLSFSESSNLNIGLHDLMFEQFSAFGTVGLSTGITQNLSILGKFWIIVTMFIGRTGPLTAVLLILNKKTDKIKYPEGKVMIG